MTLRAASGVLAMAITVGFLAVRGQEQTTAPADRFPLTIENCGVSTTYPEPPRRVVTMNQAATELMLELGLQDRLVGTAYLDVPSSRGWVRRTERFPCCHGSIQPTRSCSQPGRIRCSERTRARSPMRVSARARTSASPRTSSPPVAPDEAANRSPSRRCIARFGTSAGSSASSPAPSSSSRPMRPTSGLSVRASRRSRTRPRCSRTTPAARRSSVRAAVCPMRFFAWWAPGTCSTTSRAHGPRCPGTRSSTGIPRSSSSSMPPGRLRPTKPAG